MTDKTIKFIALFLSIASICFAQDNRELVKLSGKAITADEFVKRFELTPRIRKSSNIDSQKVHFLLSLAAEKLWAQEAYAKNLDTLYSFKQYIRNIEKLLVRDKLFEKEVIDSVKLSPGEFNEAVQRYNYELHIGFLFSSDKDEINELYNKLQSGTPFEVLLISRPEKAEQDTPIVISFGDVGQELEDSLYNLNPGEFTTPIQKGSGHAIYYMIDKKKKPWAELPTEKIFAPLNDRKKKALMEKYTLSLMNDKTIYADGVNFSRLAEELHKRLSKVFPSGNKRFYYLYEDDLKAIENNFTDNLLSSKFIKFKDDPVTLREFIHYLAFNNFKTPAITKEAVSKTLNGIVRDFIRLEVITREGYKRNYDELPEIQKELQNWKDNYLAQLLKNKYTDSARVSQNEMDKYISENNDTSLSSAYAEVSVIKTNTLEEVEVILNELDKTSDIKTIADIHGFDLEEYPLQPLPEYGSLSDIISNMNEGDIYGPIKKQNGYIIIKNEKTETREKDIKSLNLEEVRQKLFYQNLKDILETKTVELAKKYNLEVDASLLQGIKVNSIPTMVYRFYGFGGQTAAAPFLNLFYEWYHKLEVEEL